jgi:hypothetical protein
MAPWLVLTATLVSALPADAGRPATAAPAGSGPAVEVRIANGAADGPRREGRSLEINGRRQQASWLWIGPSDRPTELWLPLEVLQERLGFSSRSKPDGSLDLEWYGRGLLVPPDRQRPLADEVAVDVAGVLAATGTGVSQRDGTLALTLPEPALMQVRSSSQPGLRRVVLDLGGPATVHSDEAGLTLGVRSGPGPLGQLRELGLAGVQDREGLRLRPASGQRPSKVFTLGSPHRVVIDLPAAVAADSGTPATTIDPRLRSLLGQELRWDRLERQVGSRRIRINAVRIDPRSGPLELRALSRPEGMQGLSSLSGLARRYDALVAINGGFFNRVRRLPLGALKDQGRWLSGPILNRGVVAWESRALPRFGRLRLDEWVVDERGGRQPVEFVNSGFVKRGISRYSSAWGPAYQALSGTETAVLVQGGVVTQQFAPARLAAGVRLAPGDLLLVARAGAPLPWRPGDRLRLESRPSSNLGEATNVLGGGPLLLLDGRPVLDGRAEGFSPSFLTQGAPRTVIGSDGRFLWLVTLEGVDDSGPTLGEAALALQQVGLRDALNLDGGSSTGLVMGGLHTVKGRGVAGSVHNALGLVPAGSASAGS